MSGVTSNIERSPGVPGVSDPQTVKANLLAVRELLADPERHTTRTYARNERGMPVSYDSPHAVCWCLIGAIAKVTEVEKGKYRYHAVMGVLNEASNYEGLSDINDQPRSHKIVLKLLDKAIAEVSQ